MKPQSFTVLLVSFSLLFSSLPMVAQSQSIPLFADPAPMPSNAPDRQADKVRNIQVSAEQLQQPLRSTDEFNKLTDALQSNRNKASDSIQPSEIFTNSDDQPVKFNAPIQRF